MTNISEEHTHSKSTLYTDPRYTKPQRLPAGSAANLMLLLSALWLYFRATSSLTNLNRCYLFQVSRLECFLCSAICLIEDLSTISELSRIH